MASRRSTQEIDGELARLRKELAEYRSAVEELQVLNDIAVTAATSTDVDQTLHHIVQRSVRALKAEQGSIHLLSEEEGKPLKTLVRRDDRSRTQAPADVSAIITGWVLSHEEPLLIADFAGDARFRPSATELDAVRTLLSAPIWFEGKIIGLLTMLNKKDGTAFTSGDLTLLSIVAVQAGQLIKNAELRQENIRRMQETNLARWETEKLQELDRLKSGFFTGITHELRTPLALIMGPLEQLMAGSLRGDVQRHYALMYGQAARLLRRVNDLLALATIDAGAMTLLVAPVDVAALSRRVVASFASAAAGKEITLSLESEGAPASVYCDGEKVDTILTNLLANAVKFTPRGGRIVVGVYAGRTGVDDAGIEVSVADTGIGIPEEERGRIFERFQRSAASPLAESAGIGLALVKELVGIHFGTITVESKVNEGSRFAFRIPGEKGFYERAKVPVSERGTDAAERAIPGALEHRAEEETPATASEILIVEDDADLRQFLRESLAPGHSVLEGRDGEEGLALALEHLPDLVISDVLMPGLDGLSLCRKLKVDERTSHIPVILLTSKAELESRVRGLETGADDYVAKPFSPRELSARVANLLEQRKSLRERYRREIVLEPKGIPITPADESFLSRVMGVIEERIDDSELSVESLAAGVGMSRTHLNRKLNALTDQSANEFIRTYRLKRAAQLLEGKRGNVSEIAYDVGFNNPSYFAESFRGLFGCSPSEYARNADRSGHGGRSEGTPSPPPGGAPRTRGAG